MRLMLVALALSPAFATQSASDRAVARMQELVAQVPPNIAADLNLLASKSLEARHPDLAQKLKPAVAEHKGGVPQRPPAPSPEARSIQDRMRTMRGLPTDADRAKLTTELASEIQALPAGTEKLNLARSLSNLATEGDLGKPALTAVAGALGQGMRDQAAASGNDYVTLAKFARYEHVTLPESGPAVQMADALLTLREAVVEENGFNLTALDGKAYSLAELRGKVVLLNFWATWCPPCRKEMPDMEKLYRTFADKGLLILAVSDEKRDVVEKFLQEKGYTFPILLDSDRQTNNDFSVEGIPKSFLFDRNVKLVAQSIDMRTEAQFRAMLKQAGLE